MGDVLTDWSTSTPIGHLVEDNGISLPPPEVAEEVVQGVNGQRRGLTAQYVASLDLSDPADRRKLLRVLDDVLADVLPREGDENGDRARRKLLRALTDYGFALGPDGQLRAVAGRRVEIPLDQIADIEVLQEHLERIDREVDTDPAGALSAVKAGDTSLKMVLDGLYKVAIGIDELRNRYGRDHGRDTPLRGLTERHARLAVHSGTAYCRFLLDTLADPAAPWRKTPDDFAEVQSHGHGATGTGG